MTDGRFTANSLIGAVQVALALLTAPLSRLWYNRWGATEEEVRRPLPGDDLIASPRIGYTRAITIHAPAARIWPWLVQMGQGRGGLYSYDGLENLAGCDIHSADRIVPEWQALQVGDFVWLGPPEKNYPGQVVVGLEPKRVLVMQALDPKTKQAANAASWVFFLDEQGDDTTRLIVRQRLAYDGLGASILWHIVEPINFVMERRMLLGIKARAETL